MISAQRKARLKEMDALLRSEDGLQIESALNRWSVQRPTLDLDLHRLRSSVGPIVLSGRGRTSVYRYADPGGALRLEVAEEVSGDVKESLFRMNRRNTVLNEILKKISELRSVDAFGANWVLEQLKSY